MSRSPRLRPSEDPLWETSSGACKPISASRTGLTPSYSAVDIAISPTRRRRDHRCDSSSSCDPIASVTDSVSAGATAHHHTKSRTFPAEGFRAASIPKKRSFCSQYICEQQYKLHDAPYPCPRRRSTGRNRRASTSDDRRSKETSHLSARSVLEDPSILLVQKW